MGGVGAIPPTEVEMLMRLWRITEWDAQIEFVEMVRALDHEYLEFQAEKYEQDKRKKTVNEAGK